MKLPKFDLSPYQDILRYAAFNTIRDKNYHLITPDEAYNLGAFAIWKAIQTRGIERCNRSYLATAAKWTITNEIRHRAAWYRSETDIVGSEEDDHQTIENMFGKEDNTDSVFDSTLTIRWISNALNTYTPRDKQIFLDRILSGTKIDEIAEKHGISGSRVTRIIQRIQTELRTEKVKLGM